MLSRPRAHMVRDVIHLSPVIRAGQSCDVFSGAITVMDQRENYLYSGRYIGFVSLLRRESQRIGERKQSEYSQINLTKKPNGKFKQNSKEMLVTSLRAAAVVVLLFLFALSRTSIGAHARLSPRENLEHCVRRASRLTRRPA